MKKKKLRLKKPFLLLVLSLIILLGFSFYQVIDHMFFEKKNDLVSDEVLNYEDIMIKYARENNVEEYLEILQAMMMQESRGQGNDPMQSSECEFNTQYERKPNSIEDPEYSIEVGIKYFAKCIDRADVESLEDKENIYLALQAYNFGAGYIEYVRQNDEMYTYQNAIEFSEKCKREQGVNVYGDTQYVYHVLRYYPDTTFVEDWLEKYR